MNMYKLLISLCLFFAHSALLEASEVKLPAASVVRLAGKTPETYISGMLDTGKATVGYNGKSHFHCLIGFDQVTLVENVEGVEELTLSVKYAWSKESSIPTDWTVSFAGVTPNLELKNEQAWKLYSGKDGEVGTIPETVKSNESHSFPVLKQVKLKELSPVNRYVWFRIEESSPTNKLTIAGFSNKVEDHLLVIKQSQLP